jgi:TetR/AcrR family acrAB operon transcriptional repressor
VQPHVLATGLWATMDGLIRNWMFEPASFGLVQTGDQVIRTMFEGIRAK